MLGGWADRINAQPIGRARSQSLETPSTRPCRTSPADTSRVRPVRRTACRRPAPRSRPTAATRAGTNWWSRPIQYRDVEPIQMTLVSSASQCAGASGLDTVRKHAAASSTNPSMPRSRYATTFVSTTAFTAAQPPSTRQSRPTSAGASASASPLRSGQGRRVVPRHTPPADLAPPAPSIGCGVEPGSSRTAAGEFLEGRTRRGRAALRRG